MNFKFKNTNTAGASCLKRLYPLLEATNVSWQLPTARFCPKMLNFVTQPLTNFCLREAKVILKKRIVLTLNVHDLVNVPNLIGRFL